MVWIGSSKKAPRISIFSIAMGADYLSYMNSIATYAPAFYGYNDLVLARVYHKVPNSSMFCIVESLDW